MRVTTDTKKFNVIEINGSYSLDELIQYLSSVYPDFSWKKLESSNSLRLQMPPLPLPDDDLPF